MKELNDDGRTRHLIIHQPVKFSQDVPVEFRIEGYHTTEVLLTLEFVNGRPLIDWNQINTRTYVTDFAVTDYDEGITVVTALVDTIAFLYEISPEDFDPAPPDLPKNGIADLFMAKNELYEDPFFHTTRLYQTMKILMKSPIWPYLVQMAEADTDLAWPNSIIKIRFSEDL